MSRIRIMCCSLLILVLLLTKCTHSSRSSLTLRIHFDKDQWKNVISYSFVVPIISDGQVHTFLRRDKNEDKLPPLEPEIDTVNLTWEAGDENTTTKVDNKDHPFTEFRRKLATYVMTFRDRVDMQLNEIDTFTYWFDNLKSKNKSILYNPLLSIPASGIIPKGPKIFQMSIPCTGKEEGIADLVLGLQIMDHKGRPIKGSPIKVTLRKKCKQFETTTLCDRPCENAGRCNQFGECECKQGYHGNFCEIDMCNPRCENNGTCISPGMCLCLDGFYGKRCEEALCSKPCQNGGRCVLAGELQPGVCWCTSGYYGGACEYSHCKQPCEHDGLCMGTNKCNCKDGYIGDRCEKGTERKRRRVEQKCEAKRNEYKKRCLKLHHKCKKKEEKMAEKCATQTGKKQRRCKRRQERLVSKCKKQAEKKKHRKKCKKRQADVLKVCATKRKKKKKTD